jgi:hypothetical protein
MKVDSAPPIKRFIAAGIFLTTFTPALAPLPVLAYSVRIAGQQVFAVNTGTANLTATKRAEAIQSNLDNAIVASKDKPSTTVSITYVNGLPVITLCGYQICTVDGADAKQANTTPALLAQRWCNSLRTSLADKPSLSSYISQLSGSSGGSTSADNSASSNNSPIPPTAPWIASSSSASGNATDSYSASPLSAPQTPTLATQTPGAAASSYPPPASNYPPPASNYPPPPYGGNTQTASYPPPSPYPPSQQPVNMAYGYGANYQVPPPTNFAPPSSPYGQPPAALHGSVATAPAGTIINGTLKISISTDVAQTGDPVEAAILDTVAFPGGSIPIGSVLLGNITQSRASGRLSQSGHLGMKFTSLRLPDGTVTPISAHFTGLVGRYKLKGKGDESYLQGEGGKAKLGQTLIRGGVGAGAGAALGTAVGAIAGGPFGAGTGAWSGAAIGGGVGVADMALRKGREVKLESGTHLQIQLDQPATIPGPGNSYSQGLQGS